MPLSECKQSPQDALPWACRVRMTVPAKGIRKTLRLFEKQPAGTEHVVAASKAFWDVNSAFAASDVQFFCGSGRYDAFVASYDSASIGTTSGSI